MIKYKGYGIYRNSKTVWKHNKISGHSWPESIPLKSFYISGSGASVNDRFMKVEKAKEHIDYIIKFKLFNKESV